jgi:hypothetical protein
LHWNILFTFDIERAVKTMIFLKVDRFRSTRGGVREPNYRRGRYQLWSIQNSSHVFRVISER